MSETFRNALLTTLVILLVFVLYRRLLKVLGKKDHPVYYATVEKFGFEQADKTLQLTVILPATDTVRVDIFGDDGMIVKSGESGKHTAGKHHLLIPLSDLSAGKYYYKLYTEKQEISKNFQIL